ncbi:MAG: FecR family protein [Alphaproteobacteria bacterium]
MMRSRNRSAKTGPCDEARVEEATAWFVRMTSDLVTEADRRAFRAWIDRDPAHRAAYTEAEALWGAIGGIPDPRLGFGAEGYPSGERVRREVKVRPRQRRRLRHAAAAASLLLAAVVGLWFVGGTDSLRADHATAVGETREITLADGSVVHLNTDTAITVDLSDDCRCVGLLRGEAFFTVAPEPKRPFRVAAGGGASQALGTAFNVREAGETVTVAVAEGRVRVTGELAASGEAGRVTLAAGETARYAAAGGIETGRADVGLLTAWRQGRLVFADRRLRDVVAALDRYRPGAILFLDSSIADERFTGVFGLGDTDRALAAIEAALPIDVVRVTPWLTLLRARG